MQASHDIQVECVRHNGKQRIKQDVPSAVVTLTPVKVREKPPNVTLLAAPSHHIDLLIV